ncbi:MAG: J domain-containing protein [Proteobacteria bacterium]|nr:J domain-containing protein [Pseudomonadota bacterium]
MRRPVPADINAPFERALEYVRRCHHPGCPEPGAHRAPVARDRLNEYYWFCLEHVREYNLAWDFFAGMSEAEIEHQRRADTVWQRPSWPFGQFGQRAGRGTGYRIHDGFGFYSEDTQSTGRPRPQSEAQKALALLDLKEPVTFGDVKSRYITLVKQLHPDANGGDVEAEERLKIVNQAYAALKISFA